jgi:hypothetical protein
MLFPLLLLAPLGASVALYAYFARRSDSPTIWRRACVIAGIVTAVRIGGTWLGRYWLEETSGWLQVPGYFLALWSLPEAWLLPGGLLRRHGIEALLLLSLGLAAGSSAWVFLTACTARIRIRKPS